MNDATITVKAIRRHHPANSGRCKERSHADRGKSGTRYRCHLRERHGGPHQAPRGQQTFRWWVA